MNTPENLGVIGEVSLSQVASDVSRRKSRTYALDYARIDSEIRNGLKNEKIRLSEAWKNRLWYEGNLKSFLSAISQEMNLRMESVRTTNLFDTWVSLLTRNLYAGPPRRIIPDQPQITEYLESVYSKSNFNHIMTLANQYALVGGVSAIQCEVREPADDDETNAFLTLQKPAITHRVWPADQFMVWCHPDMPSTPWAVGVIDYYDNQRRLRVWTSEAVRTYVTRKFNIDDPWSGTAYYFEGEEKNWLGIVPFSFVWWRPPTNEFWTNSHGDTIQQFQESLTTRLWKQNDDILNQRPILQARNVRSDFKIPTQYRAGDMLRLAPVLDQLGGGPEPSIDYAYCDLSYLAQDWEQLLNDMTMFAESLGIPESAWRLQGQSAASGVAIVSEQLPLIEATERRQQLLNQYEQDAAAVTLMVSHMYLGGKTPIANALTEDFDLTINWGRIVKSRPGQELDQHLQFMLINGLTSEVRAIADLEGITIEQAAEQLEEINEERRKQATASKEISDITTPTELDPDTQLTKDDTDAEPDTDAD